MADTEDKRLDYYMAMWSYGAEIGFDEEMAAMLGTDHHRAGYADGAQDRQRAREHRRQYLALMDKIAATPAEHARIVTWQPCGLCNRPHLISILSTAKVKPGAVCNAAGGYAFGDIEPYDNATINASLSWARANGWTQECPLEDAVALADRTF